MNNFYAKVKVYHGFLHYAVEDYSGAGTSCRRKSKSKRRKQSTSASNIAASEQDILARTYLK
jgi:hypothetical protein